MKPLQHAQISAKKYGGSWSDYIELHSFLDSSKATCAHFKHRFLLHHAEGIELAVRLFGDQIINSKGQTIPIRQVLTDHLIEDVGKIVSIEDWANSLMPKLDTSFYKFLAKKREQIENDLIKGERALFRAFSLQEKDISEINNFLRFPLQNSTNPIALLFSHNSFSIFLAEKIFGYALVKNGEGRNSKQIVATREVFERLIYLRMKAIFSPADIIARTAEADWMRGKYAKKAANNTAD